MPNNRPYPRAIVDNGGIRDLSIEVDPPDVMPISDVDFEGHYLQIVVPDLGSDGTETMVDKVLEFFKKRHVEQDLNDISYELSLVGTMVVGQFRMPFEKWNARPGTERAKKFKRGPYINLVNKAKQALDRDIEVARRWLPPDSGQLDSLIQDGGIGFTPGSISFRGENRPIPIATPDRTILDHLARERWELATSADRRRRRVTVGLFDTGIDIETARHHPLLSGALLDDGRDGTRDSELPPLLGSVDDVFGHGAHTAGIVAQRCPRASINIETVRSGWSRSSDSFELARDLRDLRRCDIVVFPLALRVASQIDMPVLRTVVRQLLADGKIIVAAAGLLRGKNEEDRDLMAEPVFLPADMSFQSEIWQQLPGRIIRVGAVDAANKPIAGNRVETTQVRNRYMYEANSNGFEVASAYPKGVYRIGRSQPLSYFDGWARWTGTSFAAPRVAGAIADRYLAGSEATIAEAARAVIEEAAASPTKVVS
ncbi:MAG: S8/S53 family peptidase [Actinomycetota bacterium]